MIKKNIAILMTIIVSTTLLGGCKKELPQDVTPFTGSGAANIEEMVPEKGAKLVFWAADKGYANAIAKAFEAKYGVPVSIEQESLGSIDKISLSGPAGEGADVFISAHDNFQKGLGAGVFMELESAVTDYVNDRVSKTGVDTVINDGKLYGIPVSIEVNAMFYNKSLVDQPAESLEEIIAQADSFNDPNRNKFILLCAIGDGYMEYPFLSSAGFQLFGENGDNADDPGFDTDEYEKGLELIASMQKSIPINSMDLGNKSSLKSAFMEGTAAYFITGPWDVAQFKKNNVDFGIAPLPTYEGKRMTPFAGVHCAHVSPYTDYPIASQLLASFLVSDEGAEILYSEYKGITTLKDISGIKGLSEDENVGVFVEQFANSVPMPSVSRISFYWSIAQDIVRAVFDGKLTPKQGREKSIENWKALIATE